MDVADDPPAADPLGALVGDVDRFGREHWGVRPLHRPDAFDASALLDLDEVERLLLTGARRPTFRLVQDGVTLPPERSTRTVRLGGRDVDDVADLGRIAAAVDGGATLVLQALQRTSLPIARFCRRLERSTSHAVQANAYLTPAGAAGLGEHRDGHDVLVVQVWGAKAWTVDGLGDLRLEQRDVLYLPAGTLHAAAAQTEPSLHLTVGLLTTTLGQAVQRLLRSAGDVLARPLPLGYASTAQGRAALRSDLERAVKEAVAALEAADVDDLADAEIERSRCRRPPLLTGQLRTALVVDAATLDTEIARRLDQPARLTVAPADDGRVILELADRRLLLPPVARPALEHLLGVERCRVGDLPGIDDESKLVLARRLAREGLLTLR